jgi:hypothetical protein
MSVQIDSDKGRRHISAAISTVTTDQLWSWFAPWVFGAFLTAFSLLGFWTASAATDQGTYIFGLAVAGLSLLGLAWILRSGLDADMIQFRGVEDPDSLLVLSAVLVALAMAGLVGAALSQSMRSPALAMALPRHASF